MLTLDAIAERRIREAQERGEFEGLPGAGAPLELDDDSLVPEDLRVAYRILRNSGHLPPELDPYREIREIEQLLRAAGDAERTRLVARIGFLMSRSACGGHRRNLLVEQEYLEQLARRLAQDRTGPQA
jgi:hypothetical protein